MNKTVWTFGIVSGLVAIVMMALVVPQLRAQETGMADILGYSSMLLSALFVFFGIRSYRENAGQGSLTFGKGFAVGALITLVAGLIYTVGFQVMYFQVVPDFGDVFQSCMVKRAQAEGASPEKVLETAETAAELKRLYDQPLTNALLALGTSLPIGLAASAAAAGILRRR